MKIQSVKYLAVFILAIYLSACTASRQEKEIKDIYKTLQSLQNKQIEFPNTLVSSINGIRGSDPYVTGDSEYKMVVYTDSSGCTPCKFKVDEWAYHMRQLQILSGSIHFVFIFQKESEILEEEFRIQGMDCPVIYDIANTFIQRNHLPRSSQFHTFLLDKDNKIILAGSPVGNKKIWELYKEKILQHPKGCNSLKNNAFANPTQSH